jgi:hypothetical protein
MWLGIGGAGYLWPVRISLVCLAAAITLLGGCGSSAQERPVLDVATRFESALAGNDSATACSLLAGAAVRRINDLRPEGCAAALAALGLPVGPPASVQIWGDTALAKSAHDTLFLRRLPEGWRVIGAGCTPHGEAPYQCKADGT